MRAYQLLSLADGVVDELVIDYGDFTIDAVLEDLTPLPESGC